MYYNKFCVSRTVCGVCERDISMNTEKRYNGKTRAVRPCLVAILLIALAAALLRTVAIFTAYDSAIGYFSRGAALPVLATALCVIGCIASVAFPFVTRINGNDIPPVGARGSAPVYFATAYAAFVMLGAFGYELYRCITANTAGKLFAEASAKAASGNAYAARSLRIQGILIIIGIVSSALSAVYFVLRLGEKRSSDEWHVLFGFAPGLRCVAGLSIYFDMTVEMNSPNKLMLQAALISIMIYFLFELRMLLSAKKARPRAYAAVGLLATTLTASASVSVIAGYFSGQVANAAFFTEAFFCFNMMVYMMVRTVSFITAAAAPAAPVAEQDTANTAE